MKKTDLFFLAVLAVALPLIGVCFAALFADGDLNAAVIMTVTPSFGVIVGMLGYTVIERIRHRRAMRNLRRAVQEATKTLNESRAR